MEINLTLNVPDFLGEELQRNQDRLLEILERGLEAVNSESDRDGGLFVDENSLLELLVNQSDPNTILKIQPSPPLQERASYLLSQNREGKLSEPEQTELNHLLWLEHLVRLTKAHAAKKLKAAA